MASIFRAFSLAVLVVAVASGAEAQDKRMAERSIGNANAPIRVDEFMSMTCTHCADFYETTMPQLEKRYVETGKVRFVMHDFPLNGDSLKAAAIARCMPEDQYFPFIKTLFSSLKAWAYNDNHVEAKLIQYAALGGLAPDRAKACANDKELQDALIAERMAAGTKYHVEATPTFVINDGAEIVNGAISADAFAAIFDKFLAAKK